MIAAFFVLLGMLGLVFLALKAANLASFGNNDSYTLLARFDNIGGLKVRGQIINLAGQTEGYNEIFYVDRRNGPIDFTHTGRNKYGLIYRATVSGTF